MTSLNFFIIELNYWLDVYFGYYSCDFMRIITSSKTFIGPKIPHVK